MLSDEIKDQCDQWDDEAEEAWDATGQPPTKAKEKDIWLKTHVAKSHGAEIDQLLSDIDQRRTEMENEASEYDNQDVIDAREAEEQALSDVEARLQEYRSLKA